ncbi:hypothetical protein ACOSQ2_026775 [Xanthoceras sorbifolium]
MITTTAGGGGGSSTTSDGFHKIGMEWREVRGGSCFLSFSAFIIIIKLLFADDFYHLSSEFFRDMGLLYIPILDSRVTVTQNFFYPMRVVSTLCLSHSLISDSVLSRVGFYLYCDLLIPFLWHRR